MASESERASTPAWRARARLFGLLIVCVVAQGEEVSVGITPGGKASELDLTWRTTWASLGAVARADLYLAAAAAGKLDKGLISWARIMQSGESQYGNVLVRGALATTDIPPGVIGIIDKPATISLETVVDRLHSQYGDHPVLGAEISLITSLVREPTDERSLLALLLLRESTRAASPLMPYLLTFLTRAHENVPSAWDPNTDEGLARRAGLDSLPGGPTLIQAADALRTHIMERYAELVPRALTSLPNLLGVAGDADDPVQPHQVYSSQRFAEIWLAIRTRAFETPAGFGVLVPVGDLMNHPPEGEESNVEIEPSSGGGFVMRAKRHIKRGEQMTLSYGESLTAERALLIYGFPRAVWSRLPSS